MPTIHTLLSVIIMTIAGIIAAHAQNQQMIYAEIERTPADTVSIDLSSTCPEYQKIVMTDRNGHRRHFKSLQKAVNHLARYGWKVTTRSQHAVTMEYPFTISIVYGESGINRLDEMLNDFMKDKEKE